MRTLNHPTESTKLAPGTATGAATTKGASTVRKPNILFLFTDDQRLTTLHAVNNPDIRTPNLDRLVRPAPSSPDPT